MGGDKWGPASGVGGLKYGPRSAAGASRSGPPPASGEFGSGQWDILERIARGASLDELLFSIVSLVEHQAENMLCSILLFDSAAGVLRHGAARRLAPEICQLIDGQPVGPSAGSCGSAVFRRERVVVTDIATHSSWAAYKEPFLERGLRACWSTPIFSPAGEVLGTLAMYFIEPRGPTAEERAWVDGATHLAAIALTRAREQRENEHLVHTLGKRVKELTLLHKSARLLQPGQAPPIGRLEALVKIIPSGWSHPEWCRARIRWNDVEVCTPGFAAGRRAQHAVAPAGEHEVHVEVVYLNDMPSSAGPPFEPEEQTALDSLADLLGAYLERHQAERRLQSTLSQLRDKNQRLELHMNRMPLGYVVWDAQLTVTEWNGAAEHIFGFTAAEVIGKGSNAIPILTAAERTGDPLARELDESRGGGTRSIHEHVHENGARLVCEWFHAPLEDQNGVVVGFLSMAHDVTERVHAEEERARLQAQLRRGQRIQALGTLAGGIAHDFNNILTAISGHTHLGLNDIEEERSPHESLLAIQEASGRAVELVRRILMFSRYQQPERKSCSLVPIIEEALDLLRSSLPPGVGIETQYPEQEPMVLADSEQIHQVVMNLGANAAYAIGEHGTIQVVVDGIPGSHEELESNIDVRADRYVRITLSDTGAGMDDTILERIFEPFFTTKPTGQGTGLGLSVVHGIVKGHEGCVTVQSRPGKGTVFRIYLPEARPAPAPREPAASSRAPGTGGRVLYVDDEEPLVMLATRWLRRLGYEVTGFSDSMQALEAFRARPFDFDAVISDFSMPGLSGLDLVREILEVRKDVVVVMSSGYLRADDHRRARELGAVDVVLKPQSMAEFGRILHRILSDRQATAVPQR